MGRRFLTILACVAVLLPVMAVTACTPARDLVVQNTIMVGDAKIDVELAETAEKRSNGLQGVKQPPPGSGMLFVWEQPLETTFAIMDVTYAVDIVWIDPELRVIGIDSVSPEGPEEAQSPGAIQAVLEMAQGEAARSGIGVGDVVSAVESTAAPESVGESSSAVGTAPGEATGTGAP